MKLMFDLDPRLVKKLEAVSQAKRISVPELVAELMGRVLNRDGSASSSAEGIPSPAMADAAAKAAAKAASGVKDWETVAMVLEPLLSRFRLADQDGSQRRACLAEMKMLPQDELVSRVVAEITKSL